MNTTHSDNTRLINIALSYYDAFLKKDFSTMSDFLHPEVEFIGPLAEMTGRLAVIEAAKNLSKILLNINVRAQFQTGTQIMLAYDFTFSLPINPLRAAVLMEFKEDKISKIELFYDGRPFTQEKENIFGKTVETEQ